MQSIVTTPKPNTTTQPDLTPQPDVAPSNTILNSLAIALPLIAICAIVGYRKYRARVMQWRIQHLNHLWHLDCNEKLS
jgi:hypothetical protein